VAPANKLAEGNKKGKNCQGTHAGRKQGSILTAVLWGKCCGVWKKHIRNECL